LRNGRSWTGHLKWVAENIRAIDHDAPVLSGVKVVTAQITADDGAAPLLTSGLKQALLDGEILAMLPDITLAWIEIISLCSG
jgi:hypothetical protein